MLDFWVIAFVCPFGQAKWAVVSLCQPRDDTFVVSDLRIQSLNDFRIDFHLSNSLDFAAHIAHLRRSGLGSSLVSNVAIGTSGSRAAISSNWI
jgi:hypothetical protein